MVREGGMVREGEKKRREKEGGKGDEHDDHLRCR